MKEEEILDFLDGEEEINDKWLIPESKLDGIQHDVLDNLNANMVIKGCAGSGKTVLAIYKLARIISENLGSYAFVVYTVTLKEFIKNGIEQFEDLRDKLKELKVYYKQEVIELLDNNEFEYVDYMFIDEVQDLEVDFIAQLHKYVKKNIIVLGDDEQQIYTIRNNGILIDNIADTIKFDRENIKLLETNYRVPKAIARFSGNIIGDNGKLYRKCVKDIGEKPVINKYKSFYEELDAIMNFIDEESISDVAILVPFNKDVITVKNYFKEKSIEVEYKYNDNDNNRMISNIDFTNNIVKVLTYHSSKGLEFDYVFLPKCDKIDPVIEEKLRYRQALYVACTRAKKQLFISYSSSINDHIKIMNESE